MTARLLLAFFFCTAIVVAAVGQSTPGDAKDKNFPTTLQPVNPVKYYGPKKSKKKKVDSEVEG